MTGGTKEEIFKQFDIVTDYSDHYYKDKNVFTNNNEIVRRKIMQEWDILRESLPETIFVRVYEERINLLRAAIIGAVGTPYHDALFFFDIAFPNDYPNSPPKVYFYSYRFRFNPKLYATGVVCLSLLNTSESNEEEERWNPSASTLLQVLVSLRGLVLSPKPYFNDPENADNKSPEKTSSNGPWQSYNRSVYSLCCKMMIYQLKRPLKNFEDFISSHFRNRANAILRACKDYMDGRAIIGYLPEGESSKINVPTKFKESLGKTYNNLVVEFNKNLGMGVSKQARGGRKRKADDGGDHDSKFQEYEIMNFYNRPKGKRGQVKKDS